jgi:LysR family transcriptional regulator, glycine cleavage system transcriptional activator
MRWIVQVQHIEKLVFGHSNTADQCLVDSLHSGLAHSDWRILVQISVDKWHSSFDKNKASFFLKLGIHANDKLALLMCNILTYMPRRLPPVNALIAFEAAARHGRMTEAAHELCVTPSAVSRQVKNLEQSLGLALFEGTKNSPVLTAAGQALAPKLSLAFDHIHSAVQAATAQDAHIVQVACYNTLAAKWLLPRLPHCATQYPAIDVQLSAMAQIDALRLQTHDAVLLAQASNAALEVGLACTTLFAEAIGPVVSAELHQRHRITQAKDILTLPLLHTRSRADAWPNWAHAYGLVLPVAKKSKPAQPYQHYYFSLEATLRGQGACVAPKHLVMDDIAAGRLVAPLGFVPSGLDYVLLTKTTPKLAVQNFCYWLAAESALVNQL